MSTRREVTARRRRTAAVRRRSLGAISGLALVGTALISAGPPTVAAPGDVVEAQGAILTGDVLTLTLDGIIPTADAGYPSLPGTDLENVVSLPDVTAPIGTGIPLFGPAGSDALLSLDAITQQATAIDPTQPASASSGVAGAGINVTPVLGEVPAVGGVIDDLRLTLGAVSATASADPGVTPTGDYSIADLTLTAHSDALGAVSTGIFAALTPLTDGLNAAVEATIAPALGTIGLLGPILTAIGGGLATDASVTVDLPTFLGPVLTQDFGTQGVVINAATGTVTIDLEALTGGSLNGQPVNTQLLDAGTLTDITTALTSAVADLTTALTNALQDALEAATVTITASGSAALGLTTLDVNLSGTLGGLATGTASTATVTATLSGVGITVDGSALTSAFTAPLAGVLSTAVGQGATIIQDTVLSPVLASLSTAFAALDDVLSITLNGEPTPPVAGQDYTRQAITVGLVPAASLATITLAQASVMAQAAPFITLTPSTVEAGGTTTVDGSGFAPSTTVTIELTDGLGNPVGTAVTATTDATGAFTADLTVPPGTTPATYSVTATDTAAGTASAPLTVIADTTPPAPVITAPVGGSTTNDTTPTITGTAEPGSTVEVFVDGISQGTTTADGTGNWTLTPATPLPDGDHTATATATDAVGNTSPESTPVTFAIDTTAPAAPAITSPADGTVTSDTTPAITGTAEPDSTVEVFIDGASVGTTTADGTGAWTLTPTTPLADGDHTVTATATDAVGNTSPESTPVTVTVDTTADPPVITSPADGSSTNDSTPTITGTAEPGASVEVFVDGTSVGTATADGTGAWTFTPTTPLADGDHTITAVQTDPSGNVSAPSAPIVVTVDTAPPPAPVITEPTDGETVTDSTPTIAGTGEPGATVTVVDEKGDTVCTATVRADGTWTCTAGTALTNGAHTLTATEADAAGNASAPSPPVDVTLAARQLTSWFDHAVVHRGDVQAFHAGGFTPGEQVDAVIQSVPVDLPVTTADAQGVAHWTFVVPADFELATHTGTATSVPIGDSTSSTFRVVAATSGTVTTTGAGRLARTGGDASSELVLAALLVSAGTLALVGRRRLRRRHA